MRRLIVATSIALVGFTGCALPGAPRLATTPAAPAPAAKPACEPGVIVIESGDETPCDLIGGANTLTVVDVDQAYCDQHGGSWSPLAIAGECSGVDF